MKLGVVSAALAPLGFERGLQLARAVGCERIEIACAGYQDDLCFGDPLVLCADDDARARWLDTIHASGLVISALALHGQPLTPDRDRAEGYRQQFRAACQLASQIDVRRLTLLAGLPAGADGDRTACWISSPFPPENLAVLEWQWERRVVPYWREQGHYAAEHGCVLCFEMHPGDVVNNPASLHRLRSAVGPPISCNYDPSHLIWQGIDPIDAIATLAPLIEHVHAKDIGMRPAEIRLNGLLSTQPMQAFARRPWNFRTVGHGHDELFWRRFLAALREIGYDDTVSIEHEDQYMDTETGLRQAAALLAGIIGAAVAESGSSID
jgi:sugar phosphate isomerase/epimerase